MAASNAQVAAFLQIAAETLDAIDAVLDDCDDRTVNAVPGAPGVNSVFALITHIGGALGYWGGSFLAGEAIPRERGAEFLATGTVGQAREIVAALRRDLPRWAPVATAGIRNRDARGTTRTDTATATEEFVLAHMLRELTQHTGHLQICRDVVTARPRS